MPSPRGIKPEDRNLPLQPSPWTQTETEALHEMVQEYLWAKRFRRKLRFWGSWALGLPGACWLFWEAIENFYKLVMSKLGFS